MATLLAKNRKFTLTITQSNENCDSTPFVDVPNWVSSDPTIATVTPSSDFLSAVITAVASGSVDITVTADGLTGVWNVVVFSPSILFTEYPPVPQ